MRLRLTAAAMLLLIPALGYGAGFALFETGARSWGMGGAFAAVADDPAALYWNPAGIAFQTDKGYQIMFGATLIAGYQDFTGEDPFPGEGYVTSQRGQVFYPPHAYFIAPLNETTSFGFSILSPFGLGTWWDSDYRGRFISKKVDLMTIDFSPNLAFRLNDRLSFGLGVDYVVSTLELTRNVPLVDPFTQQVVDVAEIEIATSGLGNDGWGWHAGVLAKLGYGLSLGVSYTSTVEIAYEGEASFTQYPTGNPQLDGLVAATIPFDTTIDGTTRIEFPDLWCVGLAWSNEKWTVSGQWDLQGWSTFQDLELLFNGYPEFNETIPESYEDSDRYHLGFEYRSSPPWAFQLGFEYDTTPQPVEVMTPLLGDGDRRVYSFGASWIRSGFRLDATYQFIDFVNRATNGTAESGYNGLYETTAHLFAFSLGWMF